MSRRRHTQPPAWLIDPDWPQGSRQAKAKRAWQLRQAGASLRQIAADLHVGRTTAGELLYDPDGSRAQERRHRRHGTCADCGGPTYNGGSASNPLPTRCQQCERDRPHTIQDAEKHSSKGMNRRWSDEQLQSILRWAQDRVTDPLTTNAYLALRERMPGLPSVQVHIKRFGGWHAALRAAGLEPSQATATSTYLKRIDNQEIVEAIAELWTQLDAPPTFTQYVAWATADPDRPSGGTARNRYPRWADALHAAEPLVRQPVTA